VTATHSADGLGCSNGARADGPTSQERRSNWLANLRGVVG